MLYRTITGPAFARLRNTAIAVSASVVFALLAACGGGGSAEGGEKPLRSGREHATSFTPDTPIPADANLNGMWSPVYDWPLVAVHSVLMPDGRVMTYGTNTDGKQTGYFVYDLWDSTGAPNTGHLTLPNGSGTDIFCSSQLLLPQSGDVFIAGGDNWTGTSTTNTGNNNSDIFDSATTTLARGPNMNRPRWYSSSITLLNGETYVQGGYGGIDRPEIRGVDGAFRLLNGVDTGALAYTVPRNFIAPSGKVFGYDINGNMYSVDPLATSTDGKTLGSITRFTQFAGSYAGSTSSAAMFHPGRILQIGGNSNGALVIDINGPTPILTPTQPMSTQRQWVNATLLADGKVLATSGSQVANQPIGINNVAEIWDPTTGQWLQGASAAKARMYHSNALLLPDASVLVSGGGAPAPAPEFNNLNAEIYYPPYLFTADGQRAPRPGITTAPDALEIGKTLVINVASATKIKRVTLVKTGSMTHSFNMEQRFLDLTFNAVGTRVSIQAPTRAAEAPPGYYQLFVFDDADVPSVAKILRLGVAGNPNPAVVPTIATPGPQTATVGTAAGLAVSAADPNGDELTFSATGLPPGLALNTDTGAIDGTPTDAGSYDVAIAVTDGINTASAHFLWTVKAVVPLTLAVQQPADAVLANGSTSFTATASGDGLRYKWNFGDGSDETDWSTSPSASHAFAAAGSYNVTITVIDSNDATQSRSFIQTVYLPPTANRPTASANLVTEGAAPGARLWVVNQDNDSITAFDAATRTRLGEVAVGAAPRTLAVAASGLIWVVNKQGASISVVDPASRSVLRTIALPRASQPYGIAMSPDGATAFVALEAAGQLLRYDTASYARNGTLAVGPNPRHVSVAGDGASVYVSRFITPPLPGEATAAVSTPATAGGEVVVVDAASMAVTKTIVLQHSDKPDFENQGRGIPNYLGAMAISPDGTQAWLPSKQDNIKRGALRDGTGLNFQSTVRAISSRIVMATQREDLAKRVDHDNASLASAAIYDPRGVYLFVALETSREVAVIDAHGGFERLRFPVGRAPQGLAISADGTTLYVNNFMDRSVGFYDLRPFLQQGLLNVPALTTLKAIGTEKLAANVLLGKQLFYDARDARLARDGYMSCASCHNDGLHDGRVWDLTALGEGLRNTVSLRGRAGAQGRLHWSANFDEVQDFEGQIRQLSGGTGLMTDSAFNTGTRSQPLGDKKAGLSADLDALTAYVASLASFAPTPFRSDDGSPTGALSTAASAGRAVFQAQNCAACHGGTAFTSSATVAPMNIGTIKPSSGQRLGAALPGIDIPTLRDVWATAPYLHDGSAATLDAAVTAHKGVVLPAPDLASLVAYLREIGAEEASAPGTTATGTGTGLTGSYFNNMTLTGTASLVRNEKVDFAWDVAAPGPGVNADQFSVRWQGKLVPLTSGVHQFRTISDDGVRLWVNNVLLIDNWTNHGPTTNTGATMPLTAGQPVDVRLEYYENTGGATAKLQWRTPAAVDFVAIPTAQLYPVSAAEPVVYGLSGNYFNNATLGGTAVLTRNETVDFAWGTASPGAGVNADAFSVRWTGVFTAPKTGGFVFQTNSDDGVRLIVNGNQVIGNWTDHGPTLNNSPIFNAVVGQRYPITLEYYERAGGATMQLRWKLPGTSNYVAIPITALNPK